MTWQARGERALGMELAAGGAEWIEVRAHGKEPSPAIIRSRVADSPEAAERMGRAAGDGWWLTVHGPGGTSRERGHVGR